VLSDPWMCSDLLGGEEQQLRQPGKQQQQQQQQQPIPLLFVHFGIEMQKT